MRVAILTTDNRDQSKDYGAAVPYFGTAPEALLQGFALLPEVEVHIVTCTRRPMRSPERVGPNLYFHSLYVPKIGWMRTLFLGCVRAVRRKLQEIQPDIVHGQGTEGHNALAAIRSGFPNVVTLHGNMVDSARVLKSRPGDYNWFAARLENFTLKRTAGVLCNSRYTAEIVQPRARRTWLVPNALREVFFTQPRQIKKHSRCILLHVGVVCENKQQIKALRMAQVLHRRHPNFELHFVGSASPDSKYVQDFMPQVQQAEREGYARYLTYRSAEALIECFDQASALVHTPIAEAFGLVVAEALSRDLKIFGLKVGGIPDITADADGALLVEAGDWERLEQAIAAWLEQGHPPPQPSVELIRRRYLPQRIAQRHVEIYREVLTHSR